jgi:hypothetical protein
MKRPWPLLICLWAGRRPESVALVRSRTYKKKTKAKAGAAGDNLLPLEMWIRNVRGFT